jgi:hypothetical protein
LAVILDKKDRNLLLKSEATKVVPWLLKYLELHEYITDELVADLPEDRRNFMTNMIKRVVQQATKEWIRDSEREYPEEDLGDERTRCSLCGTPNRYVYYIVNTQNGNRMNVGSTCVEYFGGFNIEFAGKNRKQLMKEAKKLRRETELNNRFPGIAQTIHTWDDKLSSFPVLIPSYMEQRYTELGNLIRELFDSFTNGRCGWEVVDKFKEILAERELLLQQMEEYARAEASKDSPFVARRHIVSWLQRNGQHQGLQWLKEDGQIRWRTAFRIREPLFMQSIVPLLNETLQSIGVTIHRADVERGGYLYSAEPLRDVNLFITHEVLVRDYCGFLTGESESVPTLEQLLGSSVINRDEISVQHLVREMNRYLGKLVSIVQFDIEYNDLFAQDHSTGMYHQHPLWEFLNTYKAVAFKVGTINRDLLVQALRRGKSMTKQEYNDLLREREEFGKRRA